jgi:hypothetical protein
MTLMLKRSVVAALLFSLTGCSSPELGESESLGEASEALNGVLSSNGFLVKKNFTATTDEFQRELDTDRYYAHAGTATDGSGSDFIGVNYFLPDFRNSFGFTGNEVTAIYYNRGDLGLGREMHCVDRMAIDGQVACYVSNYAAGDDGSEFTFGLSREIAFRNLQAGRSVATVAMVFRKNALDLREQMMFVAYDQNGRYVTAAPLDRHGLNFAQGFAQEDGENPDPAVFGTPGVNFNNHIPTNCQNCHGGLYSPSSPGNSHRNVVGAYFLPFDLDQFEYSSDPGLTRADQEVAFRKLNQMVRKVAVVVGGPESPIVTQIDGWYQNSTHGSTLSGAFSSSYVPPGWSNSQLDTDIYRQVVRPSCRGCHISTGITFSDAASFVAFAPSIANDVQNNVMPHALQTQRLFWQSSQPLALERYLRANGKGTEADIVGKSRAGNIITLDPPLIMSAL